MSLLSNLHQIKFTILFTLISFTLLSQTLQSPESFLGYAMGKKHTPHQQIIDYFQYCNQQFPKQTHLLNFGQTEEGRPLVLIVVGSEENMARLEEIKQNNLIKAHLFQGNIKGTTPAIVWLSHSIHGNESSGSESSMFTLFELLNATNLKSKALLTNTIVVIDPCVNPDGRAHFINHLTQFSSNTPHADVNDKEHKEHWPSGRYNHYFFDLNRDWAWQTQSETVQRLAIYHQFMPHIHADLHEMDLNSPYFFAPPAKPLHSKVTNWQRNLLDKMGKNHAKYFDANGWLYYTKEVYDLFYPSYGDSWPTYNGSIGMTYEQASTRGRTALLENGKVLTYSEAVLHHHTTAMSTIEVASKNAEAIVNEFGKYFDNAISNPQVNYKSYVVKNGATQQKLTELLDKNKITYGYVKNTITTQGFSLAIKKQKSFKIQPQDLVINVAQPMGTLADILFNPTYVPEDSLTYDITAWSLGYAYGLETYALEESIIGSEKSNYKKTVNKAPATIPYAFIINWQNANSAALTFALANKGFVLRYSKLPFSINNKSFGSGTILLLKNENTLNADHLTDIVDLSNQFGVELHYTNSGLVDQGKDLGSENYTILSQPKIGFFINDKISPPAAGEVWNLLDKTLQTNYSMLDITRIQEIDLSEYNVLIFPNGGYEKYKDSNVFGNLSTWVSNGGKLILMQDALNLVKDKAPFVLKSFLTEDEKTEIAKNEMKEKLANLNRCYGDREREQITGEISGAILRVRLDTTHFIGYGCQSTYYTLKQSSTYIPQLLDAWNVGTTTNKPLLMGFVGKNAKSKIENSLVFGQQNLGKGTVIYMADDPLFRMFWEGGKLLFCNALIFK